MGDVVNLGRHTVYDGDCFELLAALPDESVDAIVCDPPYGIGFMGRGWDAAVPSEKWARECLRVLKPGGHLVAFAATRTLHRLVVACEDAGFEVRDTIHWVYWSGFPKSHDVSKAIDRAAGAEREVVGMDHEWIRRTGHGVSANGIGLTQSTFGSASGENAGKITAPATPEAIQWNGWGTALKPAVEPATLCRKPLGSTVAACVLEHGTGALNIDGCRFKPGDAAWCGPDDGALPTLHGRSGEGHREWFDTTAQAAGQSSGQTIGRFPANLYHCPKANSAERAGSRHPTVKPLRLMRWLVRLVTPPGGVVLDPFLGSGTTLLACEAEGFRCLGAEMEHVADIRLRWARRHEVFRAANPDRDEKAPIPLVGQTSLFG